MAPREFSVTNKASHQLAVAVSDEGEDSVRF